VDHACALGKWIHGDGLRAHGKSPEFSSLRDAHARFHSSVGRVIDLLKTDRGAAKDAILTGDYQTCSAEVVRAIMALKRIAT
jgi:methyl-accepting chemotaxis protein